MGILATNWQKALGAVPAAPTFGVGTATPTQVNLSWTAVNGCGGYRVQWWADGQATPNITDLSGATTPSAVIGPLADGTRYWFRVRAYGNGQDTAYTPKATVTTVLPAPGNLTQSASSSSEVNLSWTDESQDETGCIILISDDGANFNYFDEVGPNQTSYTAENLPAKSTWYFQIQAAGASTTSVPTSAVMATTLPIPAPSGLTASVASASQIDLAWTDNSGTEESGFEIDWSTDGTNFEPLRMVAADSTTFSATNLTGDTNYVFRLSAVGFNGNSGYSDPQSATTTLAIPSGLKVTPREYPTARIQLSWNSVNGANAYLIQRKTNDGAWAAPIQCGSSTYDDYAVAIGNVYSYRIAAKTNTHRSEYSAELRYVWHFPAPFTPLTPGSGIVWTENGAPDYIISRSTDGIHFTDIKVVPSDTGIGYLEYWDDDTNPPTNAVLTYRIRATNGIVDSPESRDITIVPSTAIGPSDVASVPVSVSGQAAPDGSIPWINNVDAPISLNDAFTASDITNHGSLSPIATMTFARNCLAS